jgi:hypothetical protein
MDLGAVTDRTRLPVAAYMRSYPADTWLMESYRGALEDLAARLRLPAPSFFQDNGLRVKDHRPALSGCGALAVVEGRALYPSDLPDDAWS